jgi:hypothetical protein
LGALEDIGLKVKQCLFPEKEQLQVIAQEDQVKTDEDVSISINVLNNDLNTDGWDDISISVDRTNIKGTVTIGPSGNLRYIPPKDFSGRDQFSYTATTTDGKTSTAPVIVEVVAVNDMPVTNLDEIVIKYPQNTVKIIDLVGSAKDPEGESIRLASYSVTESIDQPDTVFEIVQDAAFIVGTLEPEQMERAKGAILLNIKNWVDQIPENERTKSFTKILNYKLADISGGIADFILKIRVDISSITEIIFECQQPGKSFPDRINLQLLLSGEVITDLPIRKENIIYWGFVDFERDILFTEFENNAEIVATWEKGRAITTCDGIMWLDTTEKLKWLSLKLDGNVGKKAKGKIRIKRDFIEPLIIIPREIDIFKNSL